MVVVVLVVVVVVVVEKRPFRTNKQQCCVWSF